MRKLAIWLLACGLASVHLLYAAPGGNGKGLGVPPAHAGQPGGIGKGNPPAHAGALDTDPRPLPYATGFELSEGFKKGRLHGQYGWSVDQGKAIVSKGKEIPFTPHSGDHVAIIEEGQGRQFDILQVW